MSAATSLQHVSKRPFLAELRREIEAHPGVNHLFLARCATSPFSREDYKVFGENHSPLVCVFTNYLERLLIRAPSSEAKLWLAKVLVDEYGEGSRGEDHATLYGHFLRSCGSRVPNEQATTKVPEPAYEFVLEHRRIVTEEPFLVGLGAVGPGHEWAIPKMFASVIPGLQRAGFTPEEILYFTLHVAQDVDHGAWLEEALAQFGQTDEKQREIRRGAMLSLEARARVLERRAIGGRALAAAARGPSRRRKATDDRTGARAHGVGLLDAPRALEARFDDLKARRRPTITELIAQGRK